MDEITLSHSGASEVHLTGYRVEQMLGGGSDDDFPHYGGLCVFVCWSGGVMCV
jgi:hypothetical protein